MPRAHRVFLFGFVILGALMIESMLVPMFPPRVVHAFAGALAWIGFAFLFNVGRPAPGMPVWMFGPVVFALFLAPWWVSGLVLAAALVWMACRELRA